MENLVDALVNNPRAPLPGDNRVVLQCPSPRAIRVFPSLIHRHATLPDDRPQVFHNIHNPYYGSYEFSYPLRQGQEKLSYKEEVCP